MREKTDNEKKFYDLWLILEATGPDRGSVLKAKCLCKGKQDGGCKHVAAAMFSLDKTLNTLGEESTTSGPCKWVKRPTASRKPCEIKELVIGKRNLALKRESPDQVKAKKKAKNKN